MLAIEGLPQILMEPKILMLQVLAVLLCYWCIIALVLKQMIEIGIGIDVYYRNDQTLKVIGLAGIGIDVSKGTNGINESMQILMVSKVLQTHRCPIFYLIHRHWSWQRPRSCRLQYS